MTNHFLVFLYFYLSVLCFFKLAKGYFKSDFWSLLATIFLVISPRIFADSFYNPKDIPFLSSMIIGFFSMRKFLRKPAISSGIWHGLASAIAIDIRILGVMLPAVTFILNLSDKRVRDKNSKYLKRQAVAWSAYLLICGIFVVILWPFLWGDPIGRFVEAFNLMRKFAWDGANLYLGQYVSGKAVPWHYVPVWISITTPISILLLFLIGLAKFPWILNRVLKSDDIPEPFILAPYLWFFMPLICVIFFKSTLYDGWRQLYFIYPGLVMIATLSLKDLWSFGSRISFKPVRNTVFVIISALLIFDLWCTASFLIRSHPYQYIYFNSLTGGVHGAKGQFEMDYWGVSFKQLLERVLREMPEKSNIQICGRPDDHPLYMNLEILKPQDRIRFAPLPMVANFEDLSTTSEFLHLTTFRRLPPDWKSAYPKVCEIIVDGASIAAAYLVKR